MAHATSEMDRVFLADRRIREQFRRGPRPGRRRRPGAGRWARAQAGRGQPKAAEKPPIDVDKLLRLWEIQSQKLKTLDVWIYRIDKNEAWDEEIHYEGRAVFKKPQLAYLDFKKIKTTKDAKGKLQPVADALNPKKRATTPTETIICGADEVWQYLYPVRQIFIFPLAKEQRQRALDEGPLPFLFDMKAQEAKARYTMKILRQTEKFYLISVEPKLKEDKEAFKWAQITLDTVYLLPARIVLLSPDAKSTKDFRVEHIDPNSKNVKDSWFVGRELPNWKVIHNPNAQGVMPANVGAAPVSPRAASRLGVEAIRRPGPRGERGPIAGPGPGSGGSRRGPARLRAFDRPWPPAYNQPVSHSIDWACVSERTATGCCRCGSPQPGGSDGIRPDSRTRPRGRRQRGPECVRLSEGVRLL